MSYALQFQLTDAIAIGSTLNSGATSTTLTSGNFGSPTGTQLYVVDYGIPGSAEIISATVVGTAMTSIVRGLTGGAAGTTNHAAGATVGAIMLPQHYDRVANRYLGKAQITSTFSATAAVGGNQDVTGLSIAVTVPTGGCIIKITGFCPFLSTDSGTASTHFRILEGASQLADAEYKQSGANVYTPVTCLYTGTATAGAHTYKIVVNTTAGNVGVGAGANEAAFILVENIE